MNITETAKLYAAQISPEIDAHAARAAQTPSSSWPGSRLYRQNAENNRGNVMTRTLTAALAALALSACSTTSDGVKRVYGDPGGNISLRANEIRRLDNEGIRVEIRGDVVSSGAMYLGAQEVCIEHGVGVTFHAPHRQGLPVSEADFKMGVWEMAAYLPGKMAARLHDDWSNQSFLAGERLTAAEVVEMSNGHVPFCGPARLK